MEQTSSTSLEGGKASPLAAPFLDLSATLKFTFLFLPAMGIVSEIIPFSRENLSLDTA